MHIAVVGLSHRTAPVEVRERLSIPEQSMEVSLARLRSEEQVLEASILSTCNRLEIYKLLRHPELGMASVASLLSLVSWLSLEQIRPQLCAYRNEE
ncbi:MAG: glutamyl-tRNA reductase, partial [Synechococcaceae cyanobacterium]